MKNFAKYARFYDLLYRDKGYKKEADYVDRLIKRYSGKRNKSLLDVGCGTGGHAIWFAEKGYAVTGVDRSPEMISIAKERLAKDARLEFKVQDASKLSLKRKCDTAVSLFHVMSYLIANEVFVKSLKNIRNQLKNGGLFIFDFWYGPAVLAQRPVKRVKEVSDVFVVIKRYATPKININQNTVDLDFKNVVLNKNNGLTKVIRERHTLRYFFLPELYLMLKISGFKVLKCLKWMTFKEGVSEDSWNGVIIAKKE